MKKIDTYKIVALRKHYQLKQDDVAKALNMGRVTYIMREKHGSFTDEELNKLSELLNVERSELVKKEGSFTDDEINKLSEFLNLHLPEPENVIESSASKIPSKSFASYRETDRFKHKFLFNFFKQQPDAPKTKIEPAYIQKTIDDQVNSLIESESIYQSQYICVLEDQLLEKEQMVKDLSETLLRIEEQMQHMFDRINRQNKQLLEIFKENKTSIRRRSELLNKDY